MSTLDTLNDVTTWRVLLVDDEPDNLTLASEFLSFSGATVVTTDQGARLLEMVDEFHPTIIMLDLAMPAMDGFEVQRRLRARPELNHIPIIALTAMAMPEDAERVKLAGFDGYITKPFRIGSLLRDVKKCVEIFVERHKTPEPHAIERAKDEQQTTEQLDKVEKETVIKPTHERPDTVENNPAG